MNTVMLLRELRFSYHQTFRLTLFAIIANLFWLPAHAETVSNAMQACSTESNSLKRLVCFDRIVKNMRQYDGLDERIAQNLPPAPKVSNPPPAAVARPPEPSSTRAEDFGLQSKPQITEAAMVDGKLVATIMATDQFQKNKYRFTLNNGQIWEQTISQIGGVPKAGDAVSIESGMLGAFFLSKQGANKRFRVKRIR